MAEIFDFKLVITGQGIAQNFVLPIGETVIGRQVGVNLLLDHSQVSRRHALFNTTATECVLTDLGSSNGTYVNGEKLVPQVPRPLQPGDKIQIGPFVLILEAQPIGPVDAGPADAAAGSAEAEDAAAQGAGAVLDPPGGQPEEVGPAEQPGREAAGWKAEPVRVAAPAQEPADEHLGDLRPANELAPGPSLDGFVPVPTGMTIHSQQLIHYLPGIYQTDFMSRFLGIFESILVPIEWNIDNFDLFLDPALAPEEFLPWLANWFGILFQPYWTEGQRREFLQQAGSIFARRGTRAALAAVLKIFTGSEVEINDTAKDLPPYTFRVTLPLRQEQVNEAHLAVLINANKPAYTSYQLVFKP